ncbi:MAG: bifunctional oligoribonuclease/PAP phosphatase NrnA [Acholeplasmatales bacterium]|nr:MAG: bifunctional oligoribonuclease/PAP phosphatase NrnA [Acholeplasmatales bacterium]
MNTEILTKIHETIQAYKTIIICPHKRPDGDCMGTAFGLQDMIQSTWPDKQVYVSGEESEYVKFLGTPDTIDDSVFTGALVIAVDTAAEDRIAERRYAQGDLLIKIDHHLNVNPYGDIEYVDTTRPAAALIILDLYRLFKDVYTLTEKGVRALYTGTLTDTGRFKYPGVDGDTFRNIAMLYDLGLDAQSVYAQLDTKSEALVRFKGYVLLNYQKTPNGVAYIEMTDTLIADYGVTIEDASSLVNELSVFEDCPVWVLLAEYEEQIVRARIRSKGPAINEIANQFDGGGHPMACGANLGTWTRAKELLVALDAHVKAYKASK